MPFLARLMRPVLMVVLLLSGMVPGHAQTPAADGEVAAADWSGDWQSYWRGGLAELSLRQEGDRVTGSYLPDDGVIEGKVTGRLLEGTWREPGSSGGFIFALGDDGQTFTSHSAYQWHATQCGLSYGSYAGQFGPIQAEVELVAGVVLKNTLKAAALNGIILKPKTA